MTRALDYSIFPAYSIATLVGTALLFELGVPTLAIAAFVVAPLVAVTVVLERVRPERADQVALDQPLSVDVAHFALNYHLGYVLAFGACGAVGHGLASLGHRGFWPQAWPLALQIALAMLIAESASYWQHRLSHRVPLLWRFHALHHSGSRLNLVRAGRFHFVDIGPAALLGFLPLVVLGAPEAIVTWLGSIYGALGVLQHSNVRVRTPAWLDAFVCTPAVHRFHHSSDAREGNTNFSTVLMLVDRVWGTYLPPRAPGPPVIGIADDPVPRGFLRQMLGPFTRAARLPQ